MNLQEFYKFRGQMEKLIGQQDAAFALIHAITTQLDRMEERLADLENKRGPGRPPKGLNGEAVQR